MTGASLKKALITLFGGRGKVPKEHELDGVARIIFKRIADEVQDDGCDSSTISKSDMYAYLVKQSVAGISQKTVDHLFSKLDVSGDGTIDEEEFTRMIRRCHEMLVKQFNWDDQMNRAIPDNYVIPGSASMNSRSGTNAFAMEVVSRRSMRHLWHVFQELDSDKDNYVSLPEFKRYLKRKQPHILHMATSIFYSMDKNRDGTLSFRELLRCLFPEASHNDVSVLIHMARPEDYTPQATPDQELVDEIRAVFAIYDDDKSGSLDEEEFTHALSILGFDPAEAASMFREVDRDGSGEIAFEEFEQWYANAHHKTARILKEAEHDSEEDEM